MRSLPPAPLALIGLLPWVALTCVTPALAGSLVLFCAASVALLMWRAGRTEEPA